MKNLLIGILSFVSVGSLYYGYSQKSKADEAVSICADEKQRLEKLAAEQQLQARESMMMAQVAQHEAMVQRALAEEQIKALKNKK